MSIQDKSRLHSKIKRLNKNTTIHNLFIFNKSGICFFGKSFTDYYDMEKNLISPFLTALMSFSKEMIGKKFKTIDMGDIKLAIFEKREIYYGVLCDTIENIILLDEIISKINVQLLNYIRKNKINITAEIVYDSELNNTINNIVEDTLSDEFDPEKEEKIIEYLKMLTANDEIEGATLLTDRGRLLYSSLNKIDLRTFLKEVDFRVKICNNSILKMFYTFKNEKFIFSEYVDDSYFVILVFDSKIRFGMAEFILRKVVENIKLLLSR
ncbi:MAG: hypothetical protein ACFE8L_08155 [Candidatus Hodarchaeota archaeon]